MGTCNNPQVTLMYTAVGESWAGLPVRFCSIPATCSCRAVFAVMLSDVNQPSQPPWASPAAACAELTWLYLSPFILLLCCDTVGWFAYLTTGLKSHLGPAAFFPAGGGNVIAPAGFLFCLLASPKQMYFSIPFNCSMKREDYSLQRRFLCARRQTMK